MTKNVIPTTALALASCMVLVLDPRLIPGFIEA
jgi:hypothetical protein